MKNLEFLTIVFCFLIASCNIQQTAQPDFENDIYNNRRLSSGLIDYSTSDQFPPNGKLGACYAKCMIPDQYEVQTTMQFVYTGEFPETQEFVEFQEFETLAGSSKWVKRKSDKNCHSSDPDDCFVWCLVDEPAKVERYAIVTDTSLTKEFEIRPIDQSVLIPGGGMTEWREVVCSDRINQNLTGQVRKALKLKGYETNPTEHLMGTSTKAALIKFQKDHGLPLGQLDFDTLDALGISYY